MDLATLRDRRVLLTGHTGFKGSWLALALHRVGARVFGLSLEPPTTPNHFDEARVAALLAGSTHGDVRSLATVAEVFERVRPELVFHLAAQSLVRESYRAPLDTLATNVMGTATVLEAARSRPAAIVVVTSDKCYAPGPRAHAEDDPLGGHDPYSASKASAELVAGAYRRSFGLRIATARAGNVIGGGDWARDRVVVDAMTALLAGEPIALRNPTATRPFQHVLDPVLGYLQLGAALLADEKYATAFNFGPAEETSVRDLVARMIRAYGSGTWVERAEAGAPHEAASLVLDASRARRELAWAPRWGLDEAVERTVQWYVAWKTGATRSLDDLAVHGAFG